MESLYIQWIELMLVFMCIVACPFLDFPLIKTKISEDISDEKLNEIEIDRTLKSSNLENKTDVPSFNQAPSAEQSKIP